MESLKDQIINLLDEHKWRYDLPEGKDFIRYYVSAKNASWVCVLECEEDPALIFATAKLPVKVPVHARHRVAEYLLRVNYQLLFGSFSMDYEDGSVFFRTADHVGATSDLDDMLGNIIDLNMNVLDTHFPGIMAVAFSTTPPSVAVEDAWSGKKAQQDFSLN